MPCPAKELAGIEPFVAIFKIECGGKNTCSGAERGWCVLARDAFGHGMPCPYWGNGRDERTRSLVFQVWRDVRCDWIGAQAGMPVLLGIFGELVVEEIGQVVVIREDVAFGGGVH